jgi:dolichol kinase
MEISLELKRKLFHNLSLLYMAVYALLPRWVSAWFFGIALIVVAIAEFLRLRRPEINAWFLRKFQGLYRPSEIMAPSGIFWTLVGCTATILIFTSKRIVLPALGFLTFGDAAAALCGKKWGKKHWPRQPSKSYMGSAGFALVSMAWALLFVRWPVAILSALTGAWVESRSLPGDDNVWIPVLSGAALSIFSLLLGRH